MKPRILVGITAATAAAAALPVAVAGAAGANPQPLVTRGPTVTVQPFAALSDGQAVTITASGYPANITLYYVECSQKVDSTGSASDCDGNTLNTTETDSSGSATISGWAVKDGNDYSD